MKTVRFTAMTTAFCVLLTAASAGAQHRAGGGGSHSGGGFPRSAPPSPPENPGGFGGYGGHDGHDGHDNGGYGGHDGGHDGHDGHDGHGGYGDHDGHHGRGGIIFVGPYGDPYGYPYGYPYDGPFDDGYGLDDGLLGPPAAALPPAPPRLPYILGNRYDALPGGGCLTMIAGGAAYYDCGGEWYRQVGPAQYMAVTQP